MATLATFLGIFLVLYTTYQLGALAGIFSERSGVANVAIEGNMIVGAVLFSLIYNNLTHAGGPELSQLYAFIIAIVIAIPSAGLFMMLMALLTNRYLADHIIAGTGLNLLAPALMLLMYNWLYVGASDTLVLSSILLNTKDFVINVDGNTYMNWLIVFFVLLTLLLLIISSWTLNKTKFGLRLRSSGENPYALETSGISVVKTRTIALFIAGMLSSLAGAAFMMSHDAFFFTVKGSGFIAIGIMILGQYKVIGTFFGSIVLAAVIALIKTVITLHAGIPDGSFISENSYALNALPFVIPLIGLIILRKSYVPKAVGKNFKKDQR